MQNTKQTFINTPTTLNRYLLLSVMLSFLYLADYSIYSWIFLNIHSII